MYRLGPNLRRHYSSLSLPPLNSAMAEETQRRLAAIVAADVVGYSRLVAADELGTLSAMRTLREELWDPTTEA